MTTPLIRQGEGAAGITRIHAELAAQRAHLERTLNETTDTTTTTHRTTPAGDSRKLRGIPAIARGVTGAIPGTTPGHH
jgi:hypothetical protein